jgi:hypothetical protein
MAKGKYYQQYESIKKNPTKYKEEIHCPKIIEVMNEKGTISAFCKEVMISDGTFYNWCYQYPIFKECFRFGFMSSQENWEDAGRMRDEEFDFKYWEFIGRQRYGVGRSNCVKLNVDSNASPYEQYKQMLQQARTGDFTAAEIKQLMESINVGVRVWESFKIQEDVDQMRNDIQKMKAHGNNIVPIKGAS